MTYPLSFCPVVRPLECYNAKELNGRAGNNMTVFKTSLLLQRLKIDVHHPLANQIISFLTVLIYMCNPYKSDTSSKVFSNRADHKWPQKSRNLLNVFDITHLVVDQDFISFT